MATTIAISGKGGSGKTTLAAMIVRVLLEQPDSGAVLAVDADPNSCLGLMLGVEPAGTVADIREAARAKPPSNTGMDRVRWVEYGIQQALTESDGFDLLTMGRPEGPDCYCAVNNMLRKFLDQLSSQYQYVIIDNEAGMEHLSRRTTNNVDVLCIAAEPTSLGAITAQRILELAGKLPISIRQAGVVWNKEEPNAECHMLNAVETYGHIPYDKGVSEVSMQSRTVFNLAGDSPAIVAVRKMLERILALGTSEAINHSGRIQDASS